MLLREIVKIEMQKETKWYKTTKQYIETLGYTERDILHMSKQRIKKIIDEWDTAEWKDGMQSKTTLTLYRSKKSEIKEEAWFYNSKKANIMMKARSDTLKLDWREFGCDDKKSVRCVEKA